MKKIVCFAFITLTAICMFLGCAKKEASGEKVIKIGVFEPFTGKNASGGKQETLGIGYANSVQPTVTINGTTYKVELVVSDNESSREKAPTAATSVSRMAQRSRFRWAMVSPSPEDGMKWGCPQKSCGRWLWLRISCSVRPQSISVCTGSSSTSQRTIFCASRRISPSSFRTGSAFS